MTQDFNDSPEPGWGMAASLKIIVAIVVMIIAGAAILYVLDMLSLDLLKTIAIKTSLVGGVLVLAGLVLGLLARSKN
ncbi:MAG TPA: hypothetical protein ENJ12_06810 [Thiolapillus brandeum]|uniref:Uncharacterized protein n=1 Tax=Thiolapillus brandeum TaxID=1076588 RepID=A0A831WAI9_9GAMM|nr:hypothetical protein [Thiolapillus brandeum]